MMQPAPLTAGQQLQPDAAAWAVPQAIIQDLARLRRPMSHKRKSLRGLQLLPRRRASRLHKREESPLWDGACWRRAC